jgi:hypothetical protein
MFLRIVKRASRPGQLKKLTMVPSVRRIKDVDMPLEASNHQIVTGNPLKAKDVLLDQ